MRYLILVALLAFAGCAPRPAEPRADLRLLEVGMGMAGAVRAARLTNTGAVPLFRVVVKADLASETQEITVLGRFQNPPGTELPELDPGQEAELAIPFPPNGIFTPQVRNASVEAAGPDGHPVQVRFTMEDARPH